ncbi:MAG TPA: hypothetical protein VIO11_06110 [Candidatus Methanoperedens sp.]
MIIDYVLFSLGILGLIILYVVLGYLSARMGEGMRLPGYYRLYYAAVLALVLALAAGWPIYYAGKENSGYFPSYLMIAGNAIAIAASYKYWWWLRDEILNKNESGEPNG